MSLKDLMTEEESDTTHDVDKKYKDEKWLREQYIENDRTQEDIGDECDVDHMTVKYWRDKFNIYKEKKCYKNEDWLRERYIHRDMTQDDIARECGVSISTICRWMGKFDIHKGKKYKQDKWLREQYVDKDRSQACVADECNVHENTIRYWRDKFKIYKGNQCPLCSHRSYNLGNHLSYSDHGYPDISQYKWEILVGHVMGDASYGRSSKHGYVQWSMTNYEYMEWLNDELGWLCYSPYLDRTPEECARHNGSKEFYGNFYKTDQKRVLSDDPSSYKQMYTSRTVCHPLIDKLDWLENGEKKFPKTLRLTPTMVKIWYCDDGNLNWAGNGSSTRARITASSQINILDLLADKFGDVVCKPKISGGSLRFNVDETEELLDWMGEPPDGMEYKFCLESREKYDELKP